MRKLSWIIAGILCTTAPLSALHAAQLGEAQVESKLTQRLKVRIPLSDVKGVSPDDIKVRLAPKPYYQQSGISLDRVQGNLIFKIKKGKSGPYVVVSSRDTITDPILSFLLQVSTANSSMIREYDLLLDPPLHKRSQPEQHEVVATGKAPSPQPQTKTSPAKSGGWVKVKSVPKIAMGATYTVQRGDTLYHIASKATRNSSVPIRSMMQAIVNENPAAFPGGNGNHMLAGAKLKVPSSVTSGASNTHKVEGKQHEATPTHAATESGKPKLTLLSSADSDTTKAGQNAGSKNAVAGSSESDTPASAKSGQSADQNEAVSETANRGNGSLPTQKLPAINNPAPAATEEDIASINARNDTMSKQIGMLNDQLKQIQKQITERNTRIEKLQNQVHAAEKNTDSLEKKLHQQQNNFWINWGRYLTGGLGLLVIFLLILAIAARRRGRIGGESAAPAAATSAGPIIAASTEPTDADDLNMPADTGTSTAEASTSAEPLTDMPKPDVVAGGGMQEDVNAAVQEAQLLVSYNLHGQAVELLKDTLDRNPDELPVYRALAEIYASEGNSEELDAILDRIEERFGADQRPDIKPLKTGANQPDQTAVEEEAASELETPPATDEDDKEIPSLDFTHGGEEGQRFNEDFAETSYNRDEHEVGHDSDLDLGDEEKNSGTESEDHIDPLLDTIDFDSGASVQTSDMDLDLTHEEESVQADADKDEPLELDMAIDEAEGQAEEGAAPELTMDMDADEATEEPPQLKEEAEPSDSGADMTAEQGEDTRLGLAEAFLSVGDMESFQMIADEIATEGNQQTIDKLNKIKESHQPE